MNVTVTGGTGFIGSRLVESLVAAGHELFVVGRTARTGVAPHIHFSLWDSRKADPPADSLASSEAVVHLAGEPISQRWNPESKRRMRASRIEGTRRLVDALGKLPTPPSLLVAVSAIGYYGERGDEILTESSSPGTGFLAELCRDWEAEAGRATSLGVRVVTLRLGVVLGLGGGALAPMLPPFKMFAGGRLGDGRQWMSWIHLDDVVGLVRHSIDTPSLRGPVNATAPNPVRNSQFTRVLARTLRRPALFTVPDPVLRVIFGEMAEVMTSSQRVLPKAAEEAGYAFSFPDLGLALRQLLG